MNRRACIYAILHIFDILLAEQHSLPQFATIDGRKVERHEQVVPLEVIVAYVLNGCYLHMSSGISGRSSVRIFDISCIN